MTVDGKKIVQRVRTPTQGAHTAARRRGLETYLAATAGVSEEDMDAVNPGAGSPGVASRKGVALRI